MFFIATLFITVLFISFICSLCEAVLLSVSPAYIAVKSDGRTKSGKLLKSITDHMDRSLSAILTLNTLSHTLGSALIAYEVQKVYGETYLTAASVVLTLLILIFSEIIPKTVGTNNSKSLAVTCAYIVQAMIIVLYPLVVLTGFISKSMSRPSEEPDITRDEMIKSAELAVEEGTIHTKESNVIKNLMKLDKIYIYDIMTPRSVFTAFDGEMTVQECVDKYSPFRHSRIPVYEESLDHVIGLTHRYKILDALSQDQHHKKIKELISPISTLPENMFVSQALEFFVKEKTHLALATDDYGVVTGLVTLEDAIETLLGVEIMDEYDNVEDMRKYALEQWQERKKTDRRKN